MDAFPACMPGHHVHAWCPQSPEEGIIDLELVVNCFVGARSKHRTPGRAITALNYRVISLSS